MRVFVLGTGRCGSTTFARACEHLTNFTAGHESRTKKVGLGSRLTYPDDHIEVDNRLTWFLPVLARRYPDAYYVHLTRDVDAVTKSFLERWDTRASIVRAFGRSILINADRRETPESVVRMYIDTVTETITEFLRDRDHLKVELEKVDVDFPKFLDRIGAEGDLNSAMAEWGNRHNAS